MPSTLYSQIPKHLAVIMDGNGRWANRNGLPRIEGHKAGVNGVRALLEAADEVGIPYLTLYAFSVENWKRPKEEVEALMALLQDFILREGQRLIEKETRLIPIGDIQSMPQEVRMLLEDLTQKTSSFTERTVGLALNYGSRSEVIHAAKLWHKDVEAGVADPASLGWEQFSQYLYTKDFPDPDLIIRTSGTCRLSNFLMLQGAYAELYFSEVCWPDFSKEELHRALRCFDGCQRRFGQTAEQLLEVTP